MFPSSKVWPALADFPESSLPRRVGPLQADTAPWQHLTEATPAGAGKRPSAVIMLFIPPAAPSGPAELLFTKRTTTMRSHRGQISFAGGRSEAGDLSPRDTALRELEEELGIGPQRVTTIGMLPPVKALDGHAVYPVVGLAAVNPGALAPAPEEVAAVFSAPWPAFARGQGRGFAFNMFGNWRLAHSYQVTGGNVWGLTARMIYSASLE